jgi:hypothetical protein
MERPIYLDHNATTPMLPEVVEQEWKNYWQPSGGEALADDPRLQSLSGVPSPFVPDPNGVQPIPHAPPLRPWGASHGDVQLAGGMPAEIVPLEPTNPSAVWSPENGTEPTRLPPGGQSSTAAPPVPQENVQLTALLEKLTRLGVRDQELAQWGSGGELMRFSCNAPWANSTSFGRHFEAVAATPVAAVEQVAAEIEAWQRGQR